MWLPSGEKRQAGVADFFGGDDLDVARRRDLSQPQTLLAVLDRDVRDVAAVERHRRKAGRAGGCQPRQVDVDRMDASGHDVDGPRIDHAAAPPPQRHRAPATSIIERERAAAGPRRRCGTSEPVIGTISPDVRSFLSARRSLRRSLADW